MGLAGGGQFRLARSAFASVQKGFYRRAWKRFDAREIERPFAAESLQDANNVNPNAILSDAIELDVHICPRNLVVAIGDSPKRLQDLLPPPAAVVCHSAQDVLEDKYFGSLFLDIVADVEKDRPPTFFIFEALLETLKGKGLAWKP